MFLNQNAAFRAAEEIARKKEAAKKKAAQKKRSNSSCSSDFSVATKSTVKSSASTSSKGSSSTRRSRSGKKAGYKPTTKNDKATKVEKGIPTEVVSTIVEEHVAELTSEEKHGNSERLQEMLKDEAFDAVYGSITDLEGKLGELETAIEKATQRAKARLEASNNQVGASLALKQLLNKRDEKSQTLAAIEALQKYLDDLQDGEDPTKYQERIKVAIETRPSKQRSIKDGYCDKFLAEFIRSMDLSDQVAP